MCTPLPSVEVATCPSWSSYHTQNSLKQLPQWRHPFARRESLESGLNPPPF